MNTMQLGRTGLQVSRSGFGALPIQRISFDEAKGILRRAYEAGITFFDTARMYTDSEEKIRQRIKTARFEYSMALNYDYIVINDDPDTAANEIKSIITAEKCKSAERKKYLTEVCSL